MSACKLCFPTARRYDSGTKSGPFEGPSRVGICLSSLLEEHHGGPIPRGPPRQAEERGRIPSQLVVQSVPPNMDTVFVLYKVDGGC